MGPELCDVCGQEVPADQVFKTEVSVGQMMCPTTMTFHPACYEQASALWQPDDSYCSTDPDFPEMEQWATVDPPPANRP